MSLYDNETKIYPDLEPTAPQEPQSYWLNKLSEIETYFLDEIDARERNEKKKMRRFKMITGIVDTGLITSTVITGGISIAAFASGVGLSVGIALSGTSLLLSLTTAITRKSFKFFTVKQEKHDAIKLLAQGKLDSIGQSKRDYERTARRNTWAMKKRRQKRFFTKNCKHFRNPGCQCHLKYEALSPYDFWFYGP